MTVLHLCPSPLFRLSSIMLILCATILGRVTATTPSPDESPGIATGTSTYLSSIAASSLRTNSFLSHKPSSPHAWVTIYYEAGSYDYEYLLGIRVFMHTLKATGSTADRIVLLSQDVSEDVREVFRSDGLIVQDIPNVLNPYGPQTLPRFVHVLNKIYAWSLVQYERVIMVDADNIAVRNPDVLFKCGHFCAVFLNPVSFHTGLFVVKPDKAMYETLITALEHYPSYDGADQGFLNAYFPLQHSPMFNLSYPLGSPALAVPSMRLPVHANINHVYYYERMSWEGSFGGWRKVLTMTYPVPQVFKPWCWYGYPLFNMHWVWYSCRMKVDSYANYPMCWLVLIVVLPLLGICLRLLAQRLELRLSGNSPHNAYLTSGWDHRPACSAPQCTCMSARQLGLIHLVSTSVWLAATILAIKLVPCYVPYFLAWALVTSIQILFQYAIAQVMVLKLTHKHLRVASLDIVLCAFPFLFYNVMMVSDIYFHFVVKFGAVALCIVVTFVTHCYVTKRTFLHHLQRLREGAFYSFK